MDNQRLILFIVLSALILLLWQAWEQERRPQSPTPPGSPTAGVTEREVPAAPRGEQAVAQPARAAPGGEKPTSAERVEITTDLIRVEIDTLGGDLRVLQLLKYPLKVEEPGNPVRLLDDSAADLFFTQSGLIGHEGSWPNHKSLYRAERPRYALAKGQDRLEVRLGWSGTDGLQVAKVYTFRRNDYLIDLRYEVRNAGRNARETYLYTQMLRTQPAAMGNMFTTLPTYLGAVIYSPEKKYEKIPFTDMLDKPLKREVANGWVAMLQHYFVAAWLPPREARAGFYSDVQDGTRYVIGYKDLAPTRVAPGETARLESRLYAGPKEQARLQQLPEGMDLTVDYGALTFIAAPLYWLLEFIHRGIGNWGWAIILLTVLIKLLFYPLSAASYKSMARMRRLQPRMEAIRARYPDDRQKMNQAMMELYKTEKVNPLGGCLPIVIQIPVFIALYWVLLESVELRQAPFALWLQDLSSADPYYVLPLLMGATMYIQTLISPQPPDPLQRKVMLAMPVMFTVFFVFFPSGLVLYWVAQNILSIAQQWWITRSVEAGAK